jgi:hypothetical protein
MGAARQRRDLHQHPHLRQHARKEIRRRGSAGGSSARPPSPIEEDVDRVYVLDAGSSGTRISEVALDGRGCFSQITILTYGPITHLLDFLCHEDAEKTVLVDFLTAFLRHVLRHLADQRAPLYVGLTGGVRNKSKQAAYAIVLEALTEALKRIKSRRLHFGTPTMDPLEECRLEQLAIATLDPSLDGHIGMGGASIQVSRGEHCTSIPISTGTALSADFKTWKIHKKAFIQLIDSYFDSEASALAQVVGHAEGAKYGGTETIGFVAKAAGIEKNDLLPIKSWLQRLEPLTQSASFEARDLRNYVSCLIVFHLLARFPLEARLVAFGYEQEKWCPQKEIEATWSIGALADILRSTGGRDLEALTAQGKRLT